MGWHKGEAVRVTARCSKSTRIARVLRPCIVFQQPTPTVSIVREVLRKPHYFCRITHCMGRRRVAGVQAVVRYSPSIPMAQVLRLCIVLLHFKRFLLILLDTTILPTAME